MRSFKHKILGNKPVLFSWIVVLIWMGVIFCFSAQPGNVSNNLSMNTTEIIIKAIQTFVPLKIDTGTTQSFLEQLNGTIRGYTHGAVFLVLGLFLLNAFRRIGLKSIKSLISFAAAFIFGALFAALDEVHQLFVPGRACELKDFITDCSGLLIGLVIYMGVLYFYTRNRKDKIKGRNDFV